MHGHSESNIYNLKFACKDLHELQVRKTTALNLKVIVFDNTSDEDDDYVPNDFDLKAFACTVCEYECTEKKIFDEHMI